MCVPWAACRLTSRPCVFGSTGVQKLPAALGIPPGAPEEEHGRKRTERVAHVLVPCNARVQYTPPLVGLSVPFTMHLDHHLLGMVPLPAARQAGDASEGYVPTFEVPVTN